MPRDFELTHAALAGTLDGLSLSFALISLDIFSSKPLTIPFIRPSNLLSMDFSSSLIFPSISLVTSSGSLPRDAVCLVFLDIFYKRFSNIVPHCLNTQTRGEAPECHVSPRKMFGLNGGWLITILCYFRAFMLFENSVDERGGGILCHLVIEVKCFRSNGAAPRSLRNFSWAVIMPVAQFPPTTNVQIWSA